MKALSKRYLWGILLFVLPVVINGWLYTISTDNIAPIDNGTADVRAINLEQVPVVLAGNWEFYPGLYLEEDQINQNAAHKTYIKAPQMPFHRLGFFTRPGTYRLKINSGRNYDTLGLFARKIPVNTRIFIDSQALIVEQPDAPSFFVWRRTSVFAFGAEKSGDFAIIVQLMPGAAWNGGLYLGSVRSLYSLSYGFIGAFSLVAIAFSLSYLVFVIGSIINRNREKTLLLLGACLVINISVWSWDYLWSPYHWPVNLIFVWAGLNLLFMSAFLWLSVPVSTRYNRPAAWFVAASAVLFVIWCYLPFAVGLWLFLAWAAIVLVAIAWLLHKATVANVFGYKHLWFETASILLMLVSSFWLIGFDASSILDCSSLNLFLISQLLFVTEKHKLANELERNKYEIERNKALQLSFYRAQIKPHFIYNLLSSVASMTINDPRRAFTTLTKFNGYLRQLFDNDSTNRLTNLASELELVDNYLYLESIRYESIRFGTRLHYSLTVAEGLEAILLPPFSVQMLVENCIKHGALNDNLLENIEIVVTAAGNVIKISVANNRGAKFDRDKLLSALAGKERVGLYNVQSRLESNNGTLSWYVADKQIIFVITLERAIC